MTAFSVFHRRATTATRVLVPLGAGIVTGVLLVGSRALRHSRRTRPQPGSSPTSRANPNASSVVDSPRALLRPVAVRELQAALVREGYGVPESGCLDDATRAGLAAFQRRQNLADTGLPDREILHQLGLDPDAIYRS